MILQVGLVLYLHSMLIRASVFPFSSAFSVEVVEDFQVLAYASASVLDAGVVMPRMAIWREVEQPIARSNCPFTNAD